MGCRGHARAARRSLRAGAVEAELQDATRRWWEERDVAPDDYVALAHAVHDLQLYGIAWLLRRLVNEATPDAVRDVIALRALPLVAHTLRATESRPGGDADELAGYRGIVNARPAGDAPSE